MAAAREAVRRETAAVYELAPATLDASLKSFAAQAHLQLLYAPTMVSGKRSAGLRGKYTQAEALAKLLAGHRLTAVWVNPNTLLLQTARDPPKPVRKRGVADDPLAEAPDPAAKELAPIHVIGTRIPRISLETATPITVITSEDIESSGYGTLFEVLRVQPGMFGHHPIAVSSEGGASFQPLVSAAATSLYSLGPRATLFLVDGRRVANHGIVSTNLGGLFDLNGIPLSFIDRIEILRGGASAIYGTDAMAGTVNIILKKGDAGTELAARFGLSERGDARIRAFSASTGIPLRGGGDLFLAADATSRQVLRGDGRRWHTADASRFGLADGRQPLEYAWWTTASGEAVPLGGCLRDGGDPDSPRCRFDGARYRSLQPEIRERAVYAHWRQPVGDAFALYASGRFADIEQWLQAPPMAAYMPLPPEHPDADPGNLIFYSFDDVGPLSNRTWSHTSDAAVGGTLDLRDGWQWGFDLSRSENRVRSDIGNTLQLSKLMEVLDRYRFDGSGNAPDVLDALSTTIRPRARHWIEQFATHAEGKLFDMPGGRAEAAVGAELFRERLVNQPDPLQISGDLSLAATDAEPRDMRSHGSAFFAELSLPLHRAFELDLAARADRRQRFGTNWSPKIGARWAPHEKFMLRASAGEGYRPPSLYELRNPLMYTTTGRTAWPPSEPPFAPCTLEPGMDYCRIEFGTGINPGLRPEYSRQATFGVVLAPSAAFNFSLDHYRIVRRNEYGVADPIAYPGLFPNGLLRDPQGVLYRAELQLANMAESKVCGWELEANYSKPSKSGHFAARLGVSHLDRHLSSSLLKPEWTDIAGYESPKLTLKGNLQWRLEAYKATLNFRHFGRSFAYAAGEICARQNEAAGKCMNPSTTLLDLNLAYSGIQGWTFSLSVNNLTDREPVNYRPGQDGYNIAIDDPYGRYYLFSAAYRY